MHWRLPIAPGEHEVRLYFAETYPPAFENGFRVFDVRLEGRTVLDDFDVFGAIGENAGIVKSFVVTSDDVLDIEFLREAHNPAIKAIEVRPYGRGAAVARAAGEVHEIEAEDFVERRDSSEHRWVGSELADASGGGSMVTTPDTGALKRDIADSPMLAYEVDFDEAGEYFVWVRGLGDTDATGEGGSDSLHVGLNGELSDTADKIDQFPARWSWSRHTRDNRVASLEVPAPGVHTVNVWMREDGLVVDKLILARERDYFPASTVEFEAEAYAQNVPSSTHAWIEDEREGASGVGSMVTTPDAGRLKPGIDDSPMLGYPVSFPEAGIYHVWVRGLGDTDASGEGKGDSLHVGLNGALAATADKIERFPTGDWSWSNRTRDDEPATLFVPSAGEHVVNLWMREDGLRVDKLVLTTDPRYAPPPPATTRVRVNAGGPLVVAEDGNWLANAGARELAVNTGRSARASAAVDLTDPSIPDGTPEALFATERWDPRAAPEMRWRFDVTPGSYEVRLYFAETWSGAFAAGARVFDVLVNDELVLDDYDVFAEHGANKGVVERFPTTVDASGLVIDFRHVVENPMIKAIELINLGERRDALGIAGVTIGAEDAMSPPGRTVQIGRVLDWRVDVRNDGANELRDVDVTLARRLPSAGEARAVCRIESLAAGASESCAISTAASGGEIVSSVAATARGANGEVTATADAYYVGRSTLAAIPRAVPTFGAAPLAVTFSPDATTSTAIERYEWDFDGDGVVDSTDTVGRNYPWTYTASGVYDAVLTVTDSDGESASAVRTITVTNRPPAVLASAAPSNGAVPLSVRFSASVTDSDAIRSYAWDFDGDGTTDETTASAATTHVYERQGTFRPIVTVTDALGGSTRLQVPSIEIRSGPAGSPTVTASASRTGGVVPLSVAFDASASALGDDAVASWSWDFDGDGVFDTEASTSARASHVFGSQGRFFARVRLTTVAGQTTEDVVEVAVTPAVDLEVSRRSIDAGLGETTTVDTVLGGASRASVVIEDASGLPVRTLVPLGPRRAGEYSDAWDGTDDDGRIVPEGQYRAVLLYEDEGEIARLDLGLTSGGRQYNPRRTRIPSNFNPFAGEPLVIDYTLGEPSEVTAFMGRFNVNTRLITFFQRDPQGTGTHRIVWHGENTEGQLSHPPGRDRFLFGIFAYTLPDNAIFVRNRIDVAALAVSPPIFTPSGRERRAEIAFELDRAGSAEIRINDTGTGLDRRTVRVDGLGPGATSWDWDGRDDAGDFVPPGRYRIAVTAIDAAGGRSMTQYTLQRVYY